MTGWRQVISVVAVLAILLACLAGLGTALAGAPDADGEGMAMSIFVSRAAAHGAHTDTGLVAAGLATDPSYGLSGIQWQDPNGADNNGIPYYVNPNFSVKKSKKLTKAAAETAIDASFIAWVEAQDSTVVSDFGRLLYRDASLTTLTGGKLDGSNVVSWKPLSKGTIAVTYVWYYRTTGYIAEFDILLNNSYAWTYTAPDMTGVAYDPVGGDFGDPANTGVSKTFDVRNIMTHEAGHTLMLNDLYTEDAADLTMYGYGSYGEVKKDTLGYGDFLGLNALY